MRVTKRIDPERRSGWILAVDERRAERAHRLGVTSPRGASHGAPRELAEYEQRLTDGARGPEDEDRLTLPDARVAVEELIRRHPAQHERGHHGRIESGVDEGDSRGVERAVARVRAGHRQIGDPLSDRQRCHARSQLDDLPDEIVPNHRANTRACQASTPNISRRRKSSGPASGALCTPPRFAASPDLSPCSGCRRIHQARKIYRARA